MTPTLFGRWHTRILLFVFLGLPITLIFALLQVWARNQSITRLGIEPFQIISLIFLVGLVLDPLYIFLQSFRWDRDWPFAFQFVSMIVEFLIVIGVLYLDFIPFLRDLYNFVYVAPSGFFSNASNIWDVCIHFGMVFWPSFISLLGFVQIFAIRWRFKGGEWGRL
jgi:hypothetical protein